MLEVNKIYNADCLELMKEINDKSIDMILCDLPYNKTCNKWDTEINLDLLWGEYNRIIKDNGAIVLTAMQPFTSRLINSNIEYFKYSMVWKKTTSTGFLNAKKQPLRIHEDIVVFYKSQPVYNPQKTTGHKPVHSYTKHTSDGSNYGKTKQGVKGGGSTERYPTTVLEFSTDKQKKDGKLHPTQKPIALFEYLIKTYTNENDLVLDSCAGSFTTAIACINTNRNYICIEKEEKYCKIGIDRITERNNCYGIRCTG